MNKIITFIFLSFLIVIMALSGCATARVSYTQRLNETDISSAAKKGNIFTGDRAIKGKGYDVFVYGEIETKVTLKDGSIVEIKTIKASIFEKMFGWLLILKPNNISTN